MTARKTGGDQREAFQGPTDTCRAEEEFQCTAGQGVARELSTTGNMAPRTPPSDTSSTVNASEALERLKKPSAPRKLRASADSGAEGATGKDAKYSTSKGKADEGISHTASSGDVGRADTSTTSTSTNGSIAKQTRGIGSMKKRYDKQPCCCFREKAPN